MALGGQEPRTLEEALDMISALEDQLREALAIDEAAIFCLHTKLSPAQSVVLACMVRRYPNYAAKTYLLNALQYERSVRKPDKDVWETSILRVHVVKVRKWFKKFGIDTAVRTGLVGYALTDEAIDFMRENYPKLLEVGLRKHS